MYKLVLTIMLLSFLISSCVKDDNEKILDITDKQAIVNDVKVEEKWLWDIWNTWKKETIWGFTN